MIVGIVVINVLVIILKNNMNEQLIQQFKDRKISANEIFTIKEISKVDAYNFVSNIITWLKQNSFRTIHLVYLT